MTSHDGRSRKATRKTESTKEQKMKSLKFFKPSLATTLGIVLAWLLSVRPAQAGYTVTLQQVGPDVVATGSGAIDLNGLTFSQSATLNPGLWPTGSGPLHPAFINTGPISSNVDMYFSLNGPTSFGSGPGALASSGSGYMVGIFTPTIYLPGILSVPTGYVSGTALPGMAIYTDTTLATLGVTQGTYVWTWGIGPNQNFTLQILPANPTPSPTPTATTTPTPTPTPCTGRCAPTPKPRPTPAPRPYTQMRTRH